MFIYFPYKNILSMWIKTQTLLSTIPSTQTSVLFIESSQYLLNEQMNEFHPVCAPVFLTISSHFM